MPLGSVAAVETVLECEGPELGAVGFDHAASMEELASHSTAWLLEERRHAVREQRRWRVRELMVTSVLDRRGALDPNLLAADGVSERAARVTIATAHALEELPAVAAAAYTGALSAEQLTPVAQLADPESDAEWARRAPNTAPADLARLARTQREPTREEFDERRRGRYLHTWWRRDTGRFGFRGELPDLDGAFVESVLDQVIDTIRPAKGQPWDTRAQRGADALVALCRHYSGAPPDPNTVTPAPRVHMVVEVPLEGPAEIAGIPLPASMVESLRAQARVEPVLVDDAGVPVAAGTTRAALSPKITRAVLLRDGHCRWPGCTRRHGLQVHHLVPRSWGGDDTIANLAAVCTGGTTDHHARLVPHGAWVLAGNPNQPDGLTLTRHQPRAPGGHDRRGPRATPDDHVLWRPHRRSSR